MEHNLHVRCEPLHIRLYIWRYRGNIPIDVSVPTDSCSISNFRLCRPNRRNINPHSGHIYLSFEHLHIRCEPQQNLHIRCEPLLNLHIRCEPLHNLHIRCELEHNLHIRCEPLHNLHIRCEPLHIRLYIWRYRWNIPIEVSIPTDFCSIS